MSSDNSTYLAAVAAEARKWHERGDAWADAIDVAFGFIDPTQFPDGSDPDSYPTLRERLAVRKLVGAPPIPLTDPSHPFYGDPSEGMGYWPGEDDR
jgi:hypothetical protein